MTSNKPTEGQKLARAVHIATIGYLAVCGNAEMANSPIGTVNRTKLNTAIEQLLKHHVPPPQPWEYAKMVEADLINNTELAVKDRINKAIELSAHDLSVLGITNLKLSVSMRGDNVRAVTSFDIDVADEVRKVSFGVVASEISTNEITYSMMSIFSQTAEDIYHVENDPSTAVMLALLEKRPNTNNDMFHIFKFQA